MPGKINKENLREDLNRLKIYGGHGVMAAQHAVAVLERIRIPLASHFSPFLNS